MSDFVAYYVDLLLTAFSFAIFGRIVLSWVSPSGNDPVTPILYQITEPILKPIRQVMPRMGMIDLAPMVAILLLNVLVRPLLVAVL